jgi:uncharacterized protein (UPF0548 family)
LAAQRGRPLSYAPPGISRVEAAVVPPGFEIDQSAALLGRGAETFALAREAIARWAMFPARWTAIEPRVAIEEGAEVVLLVRALGVWWANAARIVYVVDEPRRRGFAYGTLPSHAERGEERFLVEWRSDDTVWYDLRAVSRPRLWAARVAYPITRALQRRFARESLAAMVAAAGGTAALAPAGAGEALRSGPR